MIWQPEFTDKTLSRKPGAVHFRVTGEWNGEPFNRVIEAENINDCYDHWMIWAQIAHADVTNIRIEELKEHQAA
ncbi:hypothetical protein FV281_22635 [Escherichia coli]|nr:hypothetical protein FV281_22635 [Escherichia coli]